MSYVPEPRTGVPFLFQPGEEAAPQIQNWCFDTVYKIAAVSWVVMAESEEDLFNFVWSGQLKWRGSNLWGDIAPVSAFVGSIGDLAGSAPTSALERLANADSEQMRLREVLQTFILGKGALYRGHLAYETPHDMSVGTSATMELSFSDLFVFQKRVKFQPVLSGARRASFSTGWSTGQTR